MTLAGANPRAPGEASALKCGSRVSSLETERLILRRFTADDVDDFAGLDGDPEVMRFMTGGRATPREEIENDFLPRFLVYYERFGGYGFWAVIEKSSGEFLGLRAIRGEAGWRWRGRLVLSRYTPRAVGGRSRWRGIGELW
jgi:RimJ/RimL family protein N-acetyltransferase